MRTAKGAELQCHTVADLVKRCHKRAKTLFAAQRKAFDVIEARMAGPRALRVLVQAPRGSGKSVLCVKFAPSLLRRAVLSASTEFLDADGGDEAAATPAALC